MNERILFITPSLWKGGAETQLLKVARHLRSQDKKILIVSLKPLNGFSEDFANEGLKVLFLRNWRGNFISNIRLLNRILQSFKADTVIAFMFIAIIFGRLLKLRFKFRLISSIRSSVLPQKWYLPFKMTAGLDDIVVYNSHASKSLFEKRKLVKADGLVINNGISFSASRTDNSVADTETNPFVWVCVAHFKRGKDFETLFKALASLKDENWRLDVVGNLYNKTWPQEMVRDLGIENKVCLLGFQPDSSEFLSSADGFVLSSFLEGMSNAILEAMAHGKPVVATDIDGNRELISNAGCGLLSQKENPVHLAAQMEKIMQMASAERQTLGEKGRAFVYTNFSEANVLKKWSELIDHYPDPDLVEQNQMSLLSE